MPSPNIYESADQALRILNVLDRRFDGEFYKAIAAIMSLRTMYLQNRHIFVRGEEMVPILKGLGAADVDFESIKQMSDLTGPDPTRDFRSLNTARYLIDPETHSIQRLEAQPFLLLEEEDYKRHDSGIPRTFDEVPEAMQNNTVMQGLLLFKALIFQDVPVVPRSHLDYGSPSWICRFFNARTHTSEQLGISGEPAIEGVHADGSDHTMTVFLGSRNMRADSAVTYLHDIKEITGRQTWETNPTLIQARAQHKHFLDTLMFADHEFKHSVTKVHQLDMGQPAMRDVLIIFCRKPRTDGHASDYADTTDLDKKKPFCLPMWLP